MTLGAFTFRKAEKYWRWHIALGNWWISVHPGVRALIPRRPTSARVFFRVGCCDVVLWPPIARVLT